MKTGRNDPCPCGSGKKYKKCCLSKESTGAVPYDPAWEAVHRVSTGLVPRLNRFALRTFGPWALDEAWEEFTGSGDEPFDDEDPQLQVFMPWFLYDWKPIPGETETTPGAPIELGVAGAFLREKGESLDPLEKGHLQACLDAPFSFHEVERCEPGRGFLLRDILTGERAEVIERAGSKTARPGVFLFGKVVRSGGVAVLEGCSPYFFESRAKKDILDLRGEIREESGTPDREAVREWESEVLETYLDLVDELLDPTPPVIQNTDGDPLCFHTIIYDITSPRAVFDALKVLAPDWDDAGLLREAVYDKDGGLKKVAFTWIKLGNAMHKQWENTSLGLVEINGGTLKVEVNSEKRANEFKSIAENRLKGQARHRSTTTKSMETGIAEWQRHRGEADPASHDEEHKRLMADPAVKARMAEFMAREYSDWADSPLPILDGKTPREAVEDPEGREMVETLVASMEREHEERDLPPIGPVFEEIRKKLGL